MRAVLLFGGKALLQDNGERLAVEVRLLCRAEVDELDFVVFRYDYVVGRDVSVDKPEVMHFYERIHDGTHYAEYLVCGDFSALALHIFFERNSVQKFHDYVSGAVCGKEVAHVDYARKVLYLREIFRLVYKSLQAAVRSGLILFRIDYYVVGFRHSRDEAAGEVFLYGDLYAACEIPGKIGDSEAALAESLSEKIFAVEHRPLRDVMRRRRRIVRALAAFGADPVLIEIAETI